MRRKQMKRRLCVLLTLSLLCSCLAAGCGSTESSDEIVLRVANWEEYIDEGDWDEEERIDLENGASILGEHSMVDDFEEWYKDEKPVRYDERAGRDQTGCVRTDS